MTALTRSPIEMTPMMRSPSRTGRCRTWRWVISDMQVVGRCPSGATHSTGLDMMVLTGVSADERPCRITLRA